MIKTVTLSNEVIEAFKGLCNVVDNKFYILDGIMEINEGSNEVTFKSQDDLPDEVIEFLYQELVADGFIPPFSDDENMPTGSQIFEA